MTFRPLMQYLGTLTCMILCIVPSKLILTGYACNPADDVVFVSIVNCPICDDSEDRYTCEYDGSENGCGESFAGCPDGSRCHFVSADYCAAASVGDFKASPMLRDQIALSTVTSARSSPRCDAPFWSWINRHQSTASPGSHNQGGL
jgi:hypothetical protein